MNIADNYRHIEGPYQNCEGEKIENQILIAGGFDLYTHHYFNPQPSNGCKKVSYCTRVKCSHLSLVPGDGNTQQFPMTQKNRFFQSPRYRYPNPTTEKETPK